MYTLQTSVKLHDTDVAGLLFFANQFKMAHDTYEGFMEQIGFGFARILQSEDFLLPIVHAEADYKARLQVGDSLTIRLTVEKIGDSSFVLLNSLSNTDGKSVGTVRTVHVCTDKGTGKKRSLPDELRRGLVSES
jgi:1,4-dihydroxy-2-naphthoyl-CoA hydrolase